jgi:hypothetical protein
VHWRDPPFRFCAIIANQNEEMWIFACSVIYGASSVIHNAKFENAD